MDDTPENRRKGWQRIALFAFYFRPSTLEVADTGEMFKAARSAPDRSRRNYFGLYPFRWQPAWRQSFAALHGGGRLVVAPILQTLIFNRGPEAVLQWAQWVATWQFERIIPAHLDAPVAANPQDFLRAFHFLDENFAGDGVSQLPDSDFQLLRDIEASLLKRGVAVPRKSLSTSPGSAWKE